MDFEIGAFGEIIEYHGHDNHVIIPDTIDGKQVTIIGQTAFEKCMSLISVTIPSSMDTIRDAAFFSCRNLTTVNILPGVDSIGELAFAYCYNLTTVNIPSSVTTIARNAFEGCDALDSESREAIWQRWPKSKGCYIATAVYGSYNCPQVWTLRRYRDFTLAENLFGRAFIRVYYAVSPTLVKWFGKKTWFNHLWRGILDRKIESLRICGINDTPYADRV